MLASAYVAAEDAKNAERVTFELVRRETNSYARFIEVAQLYLKANDVDASIRIIGSIIEQALASREDAPVLELLNEALARNPEHVEALRLLFRLHTWHQDEEGMRITLERLVEAAHAANLQDEERRALTHLVRLMPNDEEYIRRLEELGGTLEEDVDDEAYMGEPMRDDVPTFESFMLMNDAHVAEVSQEEDVTTQDSPPTVEFEWTTVAREGAVPDSSASFADLNDSNDTSATQQQQRWSPDRP